MTNGVEGIRSTVIGVPLLPGTCHLTIDGVSSEELLFLCDQAGLCASAASSCSSGAAQRSHVLAAMGRDLGVGHAALRLTIGAETTDDDVARAAGIVLDAVRRLRG